jgi:hypothetical protein
MRPLLVHGSIVLVISAFNFARASAVQDTPQRELTTGTFLIRGLH